jgi:hypothetical protein
MAPETETERVVAAIWCEVLELPQVGMFDNFFDLGGHSLLIYVVYDQLVERLGKAPLIVEFFRYPTVYALANCLDQIEDGVERSAIPSVHDSGERTEPGRGSGLTRLAMQRVRRESTAREEGK